MNFSPMMINIHLVLIKISHKHIFSIQNVWNDFFLRIFYRNVHKFNFVTKFLQIKCYSLNKHTKNCYVRKRCFLWIPCQFQLGMTNAIFSFQHVYLIPSKQNNNKLFHLLKIKYPTVWQIINWKNFHPRILKKKLFLTTSFPIKITPRRFPTIWSRE